MTPVSAQPAYAQKAKRRAIASALLLVASAITFGGLAVAAAHQRHALRDLGSALIESKTPRPDSSAEHLAELERALENERARLYERDTSTPYQFAAEVKARLRESGVTLLRVFPVPRRESAGSSQSDGLFDYELVGEPSRILHFVRSLGAGPRQWNVERLRLWGNGALLRAELTLGYQYYEPKNP